MRFAEKYPLTEQEHPLQSPQYKRWQYTLSGWIRLIKCGPNDAELECQIQDRMWEDSEYVNGVRKEFETWLSEGEKWEEEEDDIRKSKCKSTHYSGKYKGRHHGSKQKEC